MNTVNDALALMQVLDAARLSAERGRAVAVEPMDDEAGRERAVELFVAVSQE